MGQIEHVAIIMDGNGRWAKERIRPREWGHIRGASVVSNIVTEATKLDLSALSLYCFSTENWKRPEKEIKALFLLLSKFLEKEKSNILKNNIKFRVLGDISSISSKTKELITDLEKRTSAHTGLQLNFAFGYGSRKEITDSVNEFIHLNPGKDITEQDISNHLSFRDSGDVDLLIRTGGDYRISNFLLWQIAYAELYFTPVKWPDFNEVIFRNILKEVSTRERRFGGVLPQ